MDKSCKIRIYPNQTQIKIINKTLHACRAIKNKHLEVNIKAYKEEKKHINNYAFSLLVNEQKHIEGSEYAFYKGISSKALRGAIDESEQRFQKFFNKKSGYPKFISRKKVTKESYFLEKPSIHFNTGKKNIIYLPILHDMRITERSYLPNKEDVSGGRIIKENDKYYVMFVYDYLPEKLKKYNDIHMGIDLGIHNYMTIYDDANVCYPIKSFLNDEKYQKIKEKIVRLQQIIAYKAEINYGKLLNKYLDKHNGEYPSDKYKKIMKGESYNSSRIRYLKQKIKNLQKTLVNIRKDFINKKAYSLTARIKPKSITIEDLDISDMISTDKQEGQHDLHRKIGESNFYYFRKKLTEKCYQFFVELRIADQYYPSSKTCSSCGHVKKDLQLSDRVYICSKCGLEIDRDENAAKNLCFLKDYIVLTKFKK